MTGMTTSETLNRAADLIQERGWASGGGWVLMDGSHPSDGVCLEGGIQAAVGLRGAHPEGLRALHACPAYVAVSDYLSQPRLYWWNDAEGRTASEVVEVLRACAVIEASREREVAEVVS